MNIWSIFPVLNLETVACIKDGKLRTVRQINYLETGSKLTGEIGNLYGLSMKMTSVSTKLLSYGSVQRNVLLYINVLVILTGMVERSSSALAICRTFSC